MDDNYGEGLKQIDLTTDEWGVVPLLVVVPKDGDHWGVLAPLRDTIWAQGIVVVDGLTMTHALHGWATPLVRVLRGDPTMFGTRLPVLQTRCVDQDTCMNAGTHCVPGNPRMPDCYTAPDVPDGFLVGRIAVAWREGRHVCVVEGPEFSL